VEISLVALWGSTLIDMCIKSGSIENAHKVFDKKYERVDDALKLFQMIPKINVMSKRAMITGNS
jgi:hypothetical protein